MPKQRAQLSSKAHLTEREFRVNQNSELLYSLPHLCKLRQEVPRHPALKKCQAPEGLTRLSGARNTNLYSSNQKGLQDQLS